MALNPGEIGTFNLFLSSFPQQNQLIFGGSKQLQTQICLNKEDMQYSWERPHLPINLVYQPQEVKNNSGPFFFTLKFLCNNNSLTSKGCFNS